MRAKLGASKTITAAAHKLSRIVPHLLTTARPMTNLSSLNRKCITSSASNKNSNIGPNYNVFSWFHLQEVNPPGAVICRRCP